MTNYSAPSFVIEPRHLKEGLTAADYTAIAGFNVVVRPLSEADPAFTNNGWASTMPFVSGKQRSLHRFPDSTEAFSSFAKKIKGNGPTAFPLNDQRCVILADRAVMGRDPLQLEVAVSASVFLPPSDASLMTTWSGLTCIPEDRLDRIPPSRLVCVVSQLHEARHLAQLINDDDKRTMFWNELDADLFALHAVKENKAGRETRKAWVHARYLTMLCSYERYWIGPHLEASLARREQPAVQAIVEAGREIQRELVGAAFGRVGGFLLKRMPSLAEDLYTKKWKTKNIMILPENGFPLLRKITEKGHFSRSPLTHHISTKILNAAEYFSPGLTTTKSRATRRISALQR